MPAPPAVPPALPDPANPCLACGACCARYRVSFYWAEADDAPGGVVPVEATEPVNPFLRCMRGTNQAAPRCVLFEGEVPGGRCTRYEQRPSPCRTFNPWDDAGAPDPRCAEARAHWGLPPLGPRA